MVAIILILIGSLLSEDNAAVLADMLMRLPAKQRIKASVITFRRAAYVSHCHIEIQ